jgi:hypothetical protein
MIRRGREFRQKPSTFTRVLSLFSLLHFHRTFVISFVLSARAPTMVNLIHVSHCEGVSVDEGCYGNCNMVWVIGGELPKGTRPVFVWIRRCRLPSSGFIKWTVRIGWKWVKSIMIMLDPPTLSVWERDTWNLETPKKMDFSVLSDIASSVSYCSTFLVRDYLRFYGRQTNNKLF